MKLDEFIKKLKEYSDAGYGDYLVEVNNPNGYGESFAVDEPQVITDRGIILI